MGWQPLWPKCENNVYDDLVVDGADFPAGIDPRLRRLCELVIGEAVRRSEYGLRDGWCWGANCRAIAGTTSPSNHSNGKAVDINAPVNGRGTKGNIPASFYRLMESYGFEWGGRWAFTDPMHFEFKGSPRKARRLTRRAQNNFGDYDYTVGGKTFETIEGAKRAFIGRLKKGTVGDDFHVKVVRRGG